MKAYLEPADVELMERVAICPRDRLLIRLLFRLGCRVSEALALKVRGINSAPAAVQKSARLRSVSKNNDALDNYPLIDTL